MQALALPPPPPVEVAPPKEPEAVVAIAPPAPVMAAVAPVVAEPPHAIASAPVVTAPEESFPPIAAAPRVSRLPLVASAAVCLAIGFGLGLGLMHLVYSTPSSSKEVAAARPASATPAEPTSAVAVPAAPVAEAPKVAAAARAASAPAAAPEPAAPAEPKTAAPSSAIPWDDLPPATAKGCEELVSDAKGPKGFLLSQAVTNAQRALLKGDAAAAHASFCTAAHLGNPSDAVLLGLTQVLLMQSDLERALKTVDELLARAPTNKQALDWRGDILIRMGRVDEAREAWFKAAGATRASKRLVDNLLRVSDQDAATALRSGDLSRADRMLRRTIALTSGDPAHCRQLMAVLTKSGHAAAAERWRSYVSALGG